jgi:phage gpG-like protein
MAISADFEFDDKQWQDILRKLNKKYEDIKNRKEFGGLISSTVYQDIMDHFEKEQGPDGKWKQWSDSYESHLRKIGRSGNKKLQFSGKLRQTFTPAKWRGVPDGILFFNNARTKNGFPYASAHDDGGGKLPQRKFMWLSKDGLQKLVEVTLKWLAE